MVVLASKNKGVTSNTLNDAKKAEIPREANYMCVREGNHV